MNPYMNEDVMWQRVKDLQREAENRRLMGPRGSSLLGLFSSLALSLGRSLAGSPSRLVRADPWPAEPVPGDKSWPDDEPRKATGAA
jgi:hypothetical protein